MANELRAADPTDWADKAFEVDEGFISELADELVGNVIEADVLPADEFGLLAFNI
jgi:hypothetical protein